MALRKMLGSAEHPSVVRLMRLIETQSKTTLAAFAATYVAAHYLPLIGEDGRLTAALAGVTEHLRGNLSLKELKPLLRDARTAAQEETDPVRQAAKRAVATAAAVITTPTNAVGFAFYGAAAYAYAAAGTAAAREVHDALADEELARIVLALEAAAVPDEPDPVKISWGC